MYQKSFGSQVQLRWRYLPFLSLAQERILFHCCSLSTCKMATCVDLYQTPIRKKWLSLIERLQKVSLNKTPVQCLNCRRRGWRVEPPTVFSTPLAHCQIVYRGSATYCIHTIYSQFCSVSDRRKVQPPGDFSQLKHCSCEVIILQIFGRRGLIAPTERRRLMCV